MKQCIIDHATEALPKIVDGDEEFGIPNMKPLKVPEVTVDGGILKLKLSDCNIFGLDGAEVKDAEYVPSKLNLLFSFSSTLTVLLLFFSFFFCLS